jgi:hypothetical protein
MRTILDFETRSVADLGKSAPISIQSIFEHALPVWASNLGRWMHILIPFELATSSGAIFLERIVDDMGKRSIEGIVYRHNVILRALHLPEHTGGKARVARDSDYQLALYCGSRRGLRATPSPRSSRRGAETIYSEG